MYTYNISKRLCEILNTEFDPTQLPSDQELSIIPDDSELIRKPLVVTGWKHTEETKQILREQKLGKPAHNKGKPNPNQSEKMRNNNPMHNSESKQKKLQTTLLKYGSEFPVRNSFLPGQIPDNKIKDTFEFQCEQCKSVETRRATAHNKTKFCSKSCAATHSNLKRHSSHAPA
jgi:hypothetical protein